MRLSKFLFIVIGALFIAATTVNATEKEVNGQPYVLLNNVAWMPRLASAISTLPTRSSTTSCSLPR